jgi:hypothetical protein
LIVQPALFELPRVERGRWLSGIAALSAAVCGAASTATAVRAAAASGLVGGEFDRCLVVELQRRAGQLTHSLTRGMYEDLGVVTGVSWDFPTGGRPQLDVWLVVDFDTGQLRLPVNIKRASGAIRGDWVCSASTAFTVILGGSAESPARLDLARIRLELRAGRVDLQPADYLVFTVSGADDDPEWWIQGIASGVRGDRLATQLHPQQERITYNRADGVVPDDMDVRGEVCERWGPGFDGSVLREQMWLLLRDRVADPEVLAARLLDTSDDDLAALLVELTK